MLCNSFELFIIEVSWCLGVVASVLQNLQQSDCLSGKDLEGSTWEDGHSWHRKASIVSKHESNCCRQT
jgi:hypothetical protein